MEKNFNFMIYWKALVIGMVGTVIISSLFHILIRGTIASTVNIVIQGIIVSFLLSERFHVISEITEEEGMILGKSSKAVINFFENFKGSSIRKCLIIMWFLLLIFDFKLFDLILF